MGFHFANVIAELSVGISVSGQAKAGEDGSDTPDLELKVLAFIVQIAIGTGSDFLGQRLPAILRQMSHVEERKENGVLGGGE